MRASIIRTLAAVALLAMPAAALAAPDQNSNPNQNGCNNGQWINGQCVYNNNGNNNGNGRWNNRGNGQWNNNNDQRNRHRDRDDENDGRNRNNGNNGYNNGYNNNGRGNNNGYGYGNNGNYNNQNQNRNGQLTAVVSSFSPYNLYLTNGTHVQLHNGTIISPTGTNLVSGQRVRVIGYWNGDGTFSANEIDVVGGSRNRGY